MLSTLAINLFSIRDVDHNYAQIIVIISLSAHSLEFCSQTSYSRNSLSRIEHLRIKIYISNRDFVHSTHKSFCHYFEDISWLSNDDWTFDKEWQWRSFESLVTCSRTSRTRLISYSIEIRYLIVQVAYFHQKHSWQSNASHLSNSTTI